MLFQSVDEPEPPRREVGVSVESIVIDRNMGHYTIGTRNLLALLRNHVGARKPSRDALESKAYGEVVMKLKTQADASIDRLIRKRDCILAREFSQIDVGHEQHISELLLERSDGHDA